MDTPRIGVPGDTPQRALAAGLGTLLQVADLVSGLGPQPVRTLFARSTVAVRRAERGYQEAAERGDAAIHLAAAEASRRLNQAADGVAAWADRIFVRRLVDGLTPYLVEQLVPAVIDGVLPKIRVDVIPVVIDDLADDERVRAMIAQQSQDMLGWGVSEVRRAGVEGDDRVESALHRVFGRHETRP
jgi:hypothetical protein